MGYDRLAANAYLAGTRVTNLESAPKPQAQWVRRTEPKRVGRSPWFAKAERALVRRMGSQNGTESERVAADGLLKLSAVVRRMGSQTEPKRVGRSPWFC